MNEPPGELKRERLWAFVRSENVDGVAVRDWQTPGKEKIAVRTVK
jgi:hypothetical protein